VTSRTLWFAVNMVALAAAVEACSMTQETSPAGTASLELPQAADLMPNGTDPQTIRSGSGDHGGGHGGGGGGGGM
jgi:hypothetical protein